MLQRKYAEDVAGNAADAAADGVAAEDTDDAVGEQLILYKLRRYHNYQYYNYQTSSSSSSLLL